MASQLLALWGISYQRNNGLSQHFCLAENCPSGSIPDAKQSSSSSYVSGAFPATTQALQLRGRESKLSPPSHQTQSSICFYNQMLWGLAFLVLEPWAGGPGVGLGPLTLHKGPLQPRYPSQFLSATHECRTSLFCVFSPPTSPNVASLIP